MAACQHSRAYIVWHEETSSPGQASECAFVAFATPELFCIIFHEEGHVMRKMLPIIMAAMLLCLPGCAAIMEGMLEALNEPSTPSNANTQPAKSNTNTATSGGSAKASSDAAYEEALRQNLMIREMEMNQRMQIDAKNRANRQAANNAYNTAIKQPPAQKSQIGSSGSTSSSRSTVASRPMCVRSDCRAPARANSAYCEVHKGAMSGRQYCSKGTCKNKPVSGSVFCALHK